MALSLQNEDICVNHKGRALKHGISDREENLVIQGQFSSEEWKKTLRTFEPGFQKLPEKPASLKERQRVAEGDKLLLIVGLVPSDPDFDHEAAKAPNKKAQRVGSGEIMPMKEIGDAWYRVAVPFPAVVNGSRPLMKQNTQTKFYCLYHTEYVDLQWEIP